jgi:hypothetical protein
MSATYQYINVPAAAFIAHAASDHNDGLAPDACTALVPLSPGVENHGGLVDARGSFIANAELPQGARLAAFNLFASDDDPDANSTAYLVRRRLAHGIGASRAPDGVIAMVSTAGAVADTMRAFPGKIINAAVVDNSQFQYFIELVNCSAAIEPFTVQVVTVQQ